MKAIIDLTNNIRLEIQEQNEMDTLHKAIVLANPRRICDVCKKEGGKYFSSNKDTEGNIYVNYKCECGARSKLGQYKVGGFFWREFEVWEGRKESDISKAP